ncbi:UTRA domain-containing protein [Egibacter rhizosphaerae]|uniref:UTRA domain-containing protein n=1 Tax=Egibacter rhizosphaerae TaxID=1670831 RepID=A0A411YHQ7_9ACTN|nr:UTRA domain-containing protein [Egibacter rhizosphaerae]QBI20649.1 UTRA domain-containing protein [Egibacter rhizosphaerae]
MSAIDRESPLPLYHQLERVLRDAIEQGEYAPGELLPSESEICRRYDVSRSVVRQTLTNLAHAGLVHTERGRGTFVAERKVPEHFVQRTAGLFRDLAGRGFDMQTRVLGQELVELPLAVQEFLGVPRGLRIERCRLVEGKTMMYVLSYIPEGRCPGLEHDDLDDRSLYEHIEATYGLRVARGRRSVEAAAVDERVADILDVAPGAPVLVLRSQTYADDGRPFEVFEAWHRADRTRFEIDIAPEGEAVPVRHSPTGDAAGQPSSVDGLGDFLAGGLHLASAAESGRLLGVEVGVCPSADALVDRLRAERLVAVLRAPHYAQPAGVARALESGGVSIVEFTFTGENALESIEAARSASDRILVGAGSVFTLAQARSAVEAGAQFVVSPVGVPEAASASLGVPVMSSGLTPSEVHAAAARTEAPVKLFPASVGGPGYVRALTEPMPDIALVPSGGVTVDNAVDYLEAGALAVHAGGALAPRAALVDGDVSAIEARADRFVRALHGYRTRQEIGG